MKNTKALLLTNLLALTAVFALILLACMQQNDIFRLRAENVATIYESQIQDEIQLTSVEFAFVYFTTPTQENVKRWLDLFEVEHSDIVLAQSILESGHYKSEVFKTKNNLFGFCTSAGYMSYPHWICSISAYKDWQLRLYDGQMDYYYFLEEVGYAEDENYCSKLKQIY